MIPRHSLLISRHVFFALLFLSATLLLVPRNAQAQYLVDVKLNKRNFLTYEGVEATVTISNRSGSDIVMGSTQSDSWLGFDITDPQGKSVVPIRAQVDDGFVFKAGDTIGRTVALSHSFSFSDYGTYSISARVYHPLSQQYYASAKVRASFSDGKPLGEPMAFGVPTGLPGAGQVRAYSLAILRDEERTFFFVRIIDDKTKLKLTTFSLGTIVMVNDPQLTLDRENKLHVLFMTVPHIYSHCCIDTQGKIVKRLYYKELDNSRPRLTVGAGDVIMVAGGEPYDPTAPPPQNKARSVGKRPPGL